MGHPVRTDGGEFLAGLLWAVLLLLIVAWVVIVCQMVNAGARCGT